MDEHAQVMSYLQTHVALDLTAFNREVDGVSFSPYLVSYERDGALYGKTRGIMWFHVYLTVGIQGTRFAQLEQWGAFQCPVRRRSAFVMPFISSDNPSTYTVRILYNPCSELHQQSRIVRIQERITLLQALSSRKWQVSK